jgi:hypothetical protein
LKASKICKQKLHVLHLKLLVKGLQFPLASLFDAEIKACEDEALSRKDLLKEPIMIRNAFLLAMFDHHKCTTTKVQVLVKQDMLTCPPCHKKQPFGTVCSYIRCMCEQDATSGCKGTMLWLNQAMWFLVNNLERFFDSAYGNSFIAKFGAFITWLNSAARPVIQAQIIFMAIRRMMEQASLQANIDPNGKLLVQYYEAPGARQVDRLIKNAKFSLDTAPSPSPTTNKRRKFNTSTKIAPQGYIQPQVRNAYAGRGGSLHVVSRRSRGGYNKNLCANLMDQRWAHDIDN